METQKAPLINKVAESGLITLELEKYYPSGGWAEIDLKDYLFMGLILKEKEFRAQVAETDWGQYNNKNICIYCSTDAIVPPWAWMVLAKSLMGNAVGFGFGSKEEVLEKLFIQNLEQNLNPEKFKDGRVLIKGCSTKRIPEGIYMYITEKLIPVVKSLMYGEACSNVPVFKQALKRRK